MPLDDGYAVLRGTLEGYQRDDPENQGRWYHLNLSLSVSTSLYRAAVDIDSKSSAVGVQWRTVLVPASALGPVVGLAPGLHDLTSSPTSGALDYYRSPAFAADPPGCVFVRQPSAALQRILDLLSQASREQQRWKQGTWQEASDDLEAVLDSGDQLLVWGEPFGNRRGLHNVHQNQGDPVSSQWGPANGIWQDGATAVLQPHGDWLFFLNKFSSQSFQTDESGNPVQ